MQIHRSKKDKGFVVLDKTLLNDPDLSWKAKGLHSYIMGLPDTWQLNVADLSNRAKDGRDGTSKALDELMITGYVMRSRVTDAKGRFVSYDYTVFEQPQTDVNGKTVNGKTVTNKELNLVSIDIVSIDDNDSEKSSSSEKTDIARNSYFSELSDEYNKSQAIPPRPPLPKIIADDLAKTKQQHEYMLHSKKQEAAAAEMTGERFKDIATDRLNIYARHFSRCSPDFDYPLLFETVSLWAKGKNIILKNETDIVLKAKAFIQNSEDLCKYEPLSNKYINKKINIINHESKPIFSGNAQQRQKFNDAAQRDIERRANYGRE